MSRATNDLNAVRMMIGPAVMYSASTVLVFVVAHRPDVVDRRAADADRAAAAAARVDQREVFRQRDSPPVRGDPGAALRPQRGRAGDARPASASSAPTARSRRDRAVPRRQRGVRPPQPRADPAAGHVLSEHDAVSRARLAARPVAGQPRSHSRPDHARRVRRVQRVPGHAQLADDCVRLGHEHAAARDGVVEADARGARGGAGDQRRRTSPPPAAPATLDRRASRSGTSTFTYPGSGPSGARITSRFESRPGRPWRSSARPDRASRR